MEIIGTHIAISWDYCNPFHYGTYKGKLKDGRECKIEVDWKTVVHTLNDEWVGTDEIAYWLCDSGTVKSLLEDLDRSKL
jgi:hypothetical protein